MHQSCSVYFNRHIHSVGPALVIVRFVSDGEARMLTSHTPSIACVLASVFLPPCLFHCVLSLSLYPSLWPSAMACVVSANDMCPCPHRLVSCPDRFMRAFCPASCLSPDHGGYFRTDSKSVRSLLNSKSTTPESRKSERTRLLAQLQ